MRNEEKRGGKSRLRVVPVALLAIGGLWLAALAPSALANKGAKKDLAIVSVKHKGYALAGNELRVEVRIENRGKKDIGGKYILFVNDSSLPGLPGAGGQTIALAEIEAGIEVKDHFDVSKPLGRYSIEVCVKSRGDKKKGNNCRKGKDFSVIPASWRGNAAAAGTETVGGATFSSTTAPAASFFFDKLTPSGFRYTAEGTVKETVSGGFAPCTSNGSGTFAITSRSDLLLSEDLQVYAAFGFPEGEYPATQTCFGVESPPLVGPFHSWLQTGPRDTEPGATTLDGTYSETQGTLPLKWTWHFTAQP